MPNFTSREIADIVFVYGFCDGNALAAQREYRRRFTNGQIPTHQVFASTFRRLGEVGISRAREAGAPRRENVEIEEEDVIDAVVNDLTASTRRVASQLQLSQSFVSRTLRREQLHPYHYTGVQALHPGDAEQRLTFCYWLRERLNNDPDFISSVLWTDEAIFTRDGITNFRNLHHYSLDNPHVIRSRRFQQRFSINVWGGICNGSLLELQEIVNRLNGYSYRDFREHHTNEILEDIPLNIIQRLFFQHDGAPPHNSRIVTEWLNNHYGERWIGRFGPVRWPPRSPDLNPMDFFVWGCLKGRVYRDVSNTRDQLLQRILQAANEIRESVNMQQVYASLIRRCNACIAAEGRNFEQLL